MRAFLRCEKETLVMSDSPTKRAVLELKKKEGNDVCADCGKAGKSGAEATKRGASYLDV